MLGHPIHCSSARMWFATGCIIGWLTVAAALAAPTSGTLTQNINLREGPGTQYRVLTGINAGAQVAISKQENQWFQISVMKNHLSYKGWVFASYVKTAAATPAETTESNASTPVPVASKNAPQATSAPPPLTPIVLPETTTAPIPPPASPEPFPLSPSPPAADTNYGKVLAIVAGALTLLAIFISWQALRYARKYRRPVREHMRGKTENRLQAIQEKRHHLRANRLVEIDFAVGGRFFRGLIDSISAGRVFIKTTARLTVGEAITISYPAPNKAGHIKRDGQITRVTNIGIAVSFTAPPEDECDAP